VPFSGKTGFGAFINHVPDDGSLFILLAPHVGVSPTGVIGKYRREGQVEDGIACGEAIGAYNYLKTGNAPPTMIDLAAHPHDYQEAI
jgi:hypothetical protein